MIESRPLKVLCVFGQHNYGDPERGQGYEYTNFISAFENMGFNVVFFESQNKAIYRDFVDMNRRLLQTVEQEKPDVIICVLMTYYSESTNVFSMIWCAS
jgi:spore maturation protein CgeB